MNGRVIAAIVLLTAGAGLLLDQLGYLDFGAIVSTYWPLALVAIGALQLMTRSGSRWFSIALIVLGLIFQASRLGFLPEIGWGILFPLALLVAGAALLIGRGMGRREHVSSGETSVRRFVAFGGTEERPAGGPFRGGDVTALFGGSKLDLRNATLPPEGATLDVTAAFGGVEVIVPTAWRVEVRGTPVFGGFENKAGPGEPDGGLLRVQGMAMFGGVEIHN